MEGPLGTQGKVISGPVVAGELLLHGSNHATLEAILLRTGDPAWSFQTEGESLRLDWVQCRPASSMGRVYFGGPDGIVYALDAKTGKKIWSKSLGGDVETPPVVSGKIIYVSSPDHPLCALSAVDGQVLWTLNQGALGSSMNCSLAPWHGGLLAGGHALYGLKAR
jgi:outer membrane protein assembly factor BamB